MTSDEFDRWASEAVAGFAEQLVSSGSMPSQEASSYASEQHTRLLADGVATPNHHFWTAVEAGPASHQDDRQGDRTVGHLWHAVRPRGDEVESFVYDLGVRPSFRGQGWGRALMVAGEGASRHLGGTVVRLNVFGHNRAASALYVSLGYVVEMVMMRGHVGAPEAGNAQRGARSDGAEETALNGVRVELTWQAEGLHVSVLDLGVGADRLDGPTVRRLVRDLVRLCRDRGASTFDLPLPGGALEARRACADDGLVVTAKLMSKPL